MPPLYQDPLSAVPGAWRWLDLARSLVEVSSEAWAIALLALAVYSFLESEVKAVLKVFLPLALALLAAGALTLLARKVGGLPRPAGAGHAVATALRRAFPTAQTAAVAVLATYTALVYGRRARAVVLPAALVGLVHVLAGPHWVADLAGGGALGVALGATAYALTLRLAPDGHVASRRPRGHGGEPAPGPGSP